MRVYAFLSALLLSALLVAFFSALPIQAAPTWNIQTIDTNASGYELSPIIALDSNNNPHILYDGNMYASWDGSGWNVQVLTSITYGLDLVLDSKNNPHIIYAQDALGLMYDSWTGANWTSQNVDISGAGLGSVALDSSGNPHIAYRENYLDNFTVLKYASWTGSNWNIQTIASSDSENNYYGDLSLALDSKNNPHIMYAYYTKYFDKKNSG
jgi:hypothetical protein